MVGEVAIGFEVEPGQNGGNLRKHSGDGHPCHAVAPIGDHLQLTNPVGLNNREQVVHVAAEYINLSHFPRPPGRVQALISPLLDFD